MRTAHITTFAAEIAERRRRVDDAIALRQDELETARGALAHTDETIRTYKRELERLEAFRRLGVEHVQEIEVELDRARQYREGCDGILIEAEHRSDRTGTQGALASASQAEATGPFSRHLGGNGVARS